MGESKSEGKSSKKRKEVMEPENIEEKNLRKRKAEEETENLEVSSEKKAKDFCVRTFRQEIKGSEKSKSLKRFINAAKNSDDVIYEYLENGGSLQEILSIIDMTALGDLTAAVPVFEVAHLIMLRFQSPNSKHHQKCIEGARNILRSFMVTIKAMFSMDVSKNKKVALKLLTTIATLDSAFANEIMNVIALSPTLIADLIQPSAEKESVRKCFILFILSFLVEGNLTVVKNLLDKKGFLSSIIPGLKFDEAETVNLTLSLLEEKILKNVKIPKTLKLKIFNTQVIKSLFDLYDWKGPQGIKQNVLKKSKIKEIEVDQNEKDIVVESVHSFLLLLCCSQKFGVAFYDKSMGTSEQLYNQLLLTVFESLPDPLKNKKVSEIICETVKSCPDLMKPVLLKLEPSFQPRNSANWFQAMEFAENLLVAVDAANILRAEMDSLTANQIIRAGKNLCAPGIFLRISKLGSQKSQHLKIRLHSLKLLTTIRSEIQNLFAAFRNFQFELKKSFREHLSKFLPDAEDLVELWHTLCDPETFNSISSENGTLFSSTVLETFHILMECQKDAVSSPLNLISDLLSHFERMKENLSDREFDSIQVKIVKFLGMDLQSLTSNMELFEKSLLILLRSTDDSSIPYLSKILVGLNIFSNSKPEIDVWLLSYMNLPVEYRDSVAKFFIEVLRFGIDKELEGDEDSNLLQKEFAEKNGVLTDESEKTQGYAKELLSAMWHNFVELFKSRCSKSSKKHKEIRYYLNDVTIHLQLFYHVKVHLYDYVKEFNKILSKSVLSYLQVWKSPGAVSADSDVFQCPVELDMVSWIVNGESDTRNFNEIVDENNFLKLHSLFRISVAYFTKKSVDENLSKTDVKKFTQAFSAMLSYAPEDDENDFNLISFDLKNEPVYQRNCLNCIFLNDQLLANFNPFQKKETTEYYTTVVLFKVFMEEKIIHNSTVKKDLCEAWKRRFLKQLKSKLTKNKSIENLDNLDKVLDFFDYDHADLTEIIELFMAVPELNLFVKTSTPSTWTLIFIKFVKILCQKEELRQEVVQRLCQIVNLLNQRSCEDMEEIIDCFIYLLRKHPSHLLVIENEFMKDVLERKKITPSTCTLGRLLLNDPNKVQYLLKYVSENLNVMEESHIIFALLSTLIVEDDSLLKMISNGGVRTVWKSSEIDSETTPDLYNVLKSVYEKFEKHILQALKGKKEKIRSEHLDFIRVLIKLFSDKKKVIKLKEEITEGKFEPKLMYEAVKKFKSSEITENYIRGLLKLFCQKIKNVNENLETTWEEFCVIVADVIELKKNSSWESVISSPEWKEFAKLAFSYCLGSSIASAVKQDPSLLKILRLLITILYKAKEESKDCALFFQMFISHSQFLDAMLTDSPLKSESIELFRCLIERCPSEMSPKHFPILLASYSASLSARDRTLLEVLKLYERRGISVSDYEPFVWGEAAVSHYSIGANAGLSLWQRFNMGNILALLDSNRLEVSLKEFPIRRSLEETQNGDDNFNPNVYDPAFLLPLFVNLLSPGSVVFCLPFIYKGGLAYTTRALSSQCKDVRLIASVVLTRFYSHLESSRNLKQKGVWMHYIDCFRYGIEDLSAGPLPNIATLFFAKMTLELSSEPAEMYSPLQNFLFAKPSFSFDSVPEFLPLFHSSEVSYWKHRAWLLEIIRDGTRTAMDMNLIFHSMSLKVIFCFFFSPLCDNETKKLILQAIEKMLRVGKSALLITEYGLLDWVSSIDSGNSQPIIKDLLELLMTITNVLIKDFKMNKNKRLNQSHLIQILNMAMKVLPSLKRVKSEEILRVYLKIINECLGFFIKEGRRDWFKLNKIKLFDIVDAGINTLGEEYDFGKFSKIPFYFRDFDEKCNCQSGIELKNLVFLFSVLANGKGNSENKNELQ